MRTFSLLLALALGLAGTASAQTIDRIRETGEIKLGYRLDAAPLSFANADGLAAGFTPFVCTGIVTAIAEELEIPDLKASFVPVTTLDRFDKVANGEIDLLCGAATITLDRRAKVDFSIPVYVDGAVVLLPRNGSPNFKDLAGKRIGVRDGTTTSQALSTTLKNTGIEAEKVPFDSHDAGVLAVKDGQVDAYFGDQSILVYQLATKGLGSDLRLTDKLMSVEKQGLAMARGDHELRLLVDRAISAMYRSGAMQKIYVQALPGIKPGAATRAMYMIAPELP